MARNTSQAFAAQVHPSAPWRPTANAVRTTRSKRRRPTHGDDELPHPMHVRFRRVGAIAESAEGPGRGAPVRRHRPGLKANGLLDRCSPRSAQRRRACSPTRRPTPPRAAAAKAADALSRSRRGRHRRARRRLVDGSGQGDGPDGHPRRPVRALGASQRGSRLIGAIPPLLAVPTTAGTGSEVSPARW